MPKFTYVATDADGTEVKGVIDGTSSSSAGLLLAERGLEPRTVVERKSIMQFEITKKKLARKDLMQFSRQLAVFLRSGIPVLDALEIIREEVSKKSILGPVLDDMVTMLRAGVPFSGTVRSHPEAFPPFYVGVVEAAEMTGNLDQALDEVADYIDRDVEARRKISSALFYPAVVFVMSIAVVIILSTFVLPRFRKFFDELNAELPLPTRMLLSATDFVSDWWFVLAGGVLAVVLFLVFAPKTEWGRKMRDVSMLKLPVIGDLLHTAIVERFCRTLSSMVRAGVALPDALMVTSSGTNNVVFRTGLDEVRTSMMRGEGLAGPIAQSGLFPGAAKQMIRVGEETGTLDAQLSTSAEYYGRELDFKITRFTNLFEPAVILFMGVVVGFVAIALVSAMYGVFQSGNLS
jgi:type IV pilus assembly protein PilC